jgi:hypothetical protein
MIRATRPLSLALSAAVVSTLVAAVAAGNGASAEPADNPMALSGRLPGDVDSVTIAVLPRVEELKPGEAADLYVLDDAEVRLSNDKFEAFIDPTTIPAAYVGRGGLVDFTVTGSKGDRAWETETTARITRYADQAMQDAFWTEPTVTASKLITPDLRAKTVRGTAGIISARTETEDNGVFVEDQYTPRVGMSGCQISNTGQTTVRSTTIGTTYPFGGVATGSMIVGSSTGADYGIGASADNNTFQLNGSKFTQNGWSFAWSADARDRSYRKGIEYTKFVTTCGVPGNSYSEWKWKPTGETGGTAANYDISRPNWTICQNVAAGVWTRDSSSGNAYSYGGAVKFAEVIGIDLSIKRNYNSSQKLQYTVAGNNKALCGNNAYPASAGKIMMTRR